LNECDDGKVRAWAGGLLERGENFMDPTTPPDDNDASTNRPASANGTPAANGRRPRKKSA